MSEPTIEETIAWLRCGDGPENDLAIRALEEMRERERTKKAREEAIEKILPLLGKMKVGGVCQELGQDGKGPYEGEERELDLSGKVKYEKTGSEYMDINRVWIKPHTWRDISASSIVESFKGSNFDFHPNGPLKEAAERVVNTVLGSQKGKPRTWDKVTLGEVDELAKAQGERLDDDPTVWTNWRNRLRFLGEKAVNNKPLDPLTTWRSLT